MRFAVLGPLQVLRDDDVVEVSGALRQGLLALLLARTDEAVPAESLRRALWGDRADAGGSRRLHVLVHRLRGVLDDPERLSFGPGGYRLHVRPDELDVAQFCAGLDRAYALGARDPRRSARLIREALRLWRGEPYHGVELPELSSEIQRLVERRLTALEELYTAELRLGRHAVVVGDVTGLIEQHPLRERLRGLLISALYQAGRREDALAAYRAARSTSIRELGLEPGPELRALETAILAGDPVEPERSTASIRHVAPAQLPHPVAGFVGRAEELAQLDQRLAESSRSAPISTVTGTAGVGKTALVVHWAHTVQDRFPDGQVFIDLRGYGPEQAVSSGEALLGLLRVFQVDSAAIPRNPDERSALFRSLVATKRLLVILDNAASAEQVRPLLPGGSGCFVVITSRDTLPGLSAREGAQRIDLNRMGAEQCRILLRELLGDCADDDAALDRLIECCARLPLALRIAAERIRGHPTRRVTELVAELRDHREVLDALDTSGDPAASARAVFAWSYRNLDEGTARMFRRLGLHPGLNCDVHAATALANTPNAQTTRRELRELVQANLVEEVSRDRYQLHDLLRAYAAELAEQTDPPADRTAALTRLFHYYVRTTLQAANLINALDAPLDTEHATTEPPLADYASALDWLGRERANLVDVAMMSVDTELGTAVTDFSTALSWYLDLGWYLDGAWKLHAKALAVARTHGDHAIEATILRNLGLLNSRMGEQAEELGDAEQTSAPNDALARATSEAIVGALYGFNGRAAEAAQRLERSVALYRELGHPSLAHRPLAYLGHLRRKQGDVVAAAAYLHEALTIAEQSNHLLAQSNAHRGLAVVYRDAGRFDDALYHGKRAAELARASGAEFVIALAENRLAGIYRELGADNRAAAACARVHHDAARDIFRSLVSRNLEALAGSGSGAALTGSDGFNTVGHGRVGEHQAVRVEQQVAAE